jgi:nucleoside-diphosphate-sugar epimerase
MNILIPGGASYIGAWLVPQLLAEGHYVTVFDTFFFGSGFLPDNENLTIVKGDVRDTEAWRAACSSQDAVIYLASISRELLCQQNEPLAQAVNVQCFAPAVQAAKDAGIRRFIYASSVAVYGSSDHDAREDEPLAPTTIYGKGKMACEEILLNAASKDFCVSITRSASVCGYSPRQRLDLTVNRMVHDACRKGVITVEGGEQVRSHVHIRDLSDFYMLLLNTPAAFSAGEAFNVVAENQAVKDTAKLVADITKTKIVTTPRVDDRSYSVSGEKAAQRMWFMTQWMVQDAIEDLKLKFDNGYWQDSATNPVYQNMVEV